MKFILQPLIFRFYVRFQEGCTKPKTKQAAGGFEVEECHRVSYHWRSEMGLASDTQVPQNLRESPLPWASGIVIGKQNVGGGGCLFLFREVMDGIFGWGAAV